MVRKLPRPKQSRGFSMTTIAGFLTDDHRHCDDVFVAAEQLAAQGRWEEAQLRCGEFAGAIERHFAREEDLLFPAFEAATGMTTGPTAVMRMEHRQIRQMLASLQEALARRDRNDCLGITETLLLLMQQHNAKEENILYPMSDRTLGASAAGLVADMQKR
jgi:iron-sulfur cluster repair protein YtfE (RIC family)